MPRRLGLRRTVEKVAAAFVGRNAAPAARPGGPNGWPTNDGMIDPNALLSDSACLDSG